MSETAYDAAYDELGRPLALTCSPTTSSDFFPSI